MVTTNDNGSNSYSTAKGKGNCKCSRCARQSAFYLQCFMVISALNNALNVHNGITFRLSLTVHVYNGAVNA